LEEGSCRLIEGARADLERSPTYRLASERLVAIEGALAAELPEGRAARAA
jgi:hypothetical protein